MQAEEIERRIEQETKAEKHIQKLLLLGMLVVSCAGLTSLLPFASLFPPFLV